MAIDGFWPIISANLQSPLPSGEIFWGLTSEIVNNNYCLCNNINMLTSYCAQGFHHGYKLASPNLKSHRVTS